MSNEPDFSDLSRIPKAGFLSWMDKHKLKVPDGLEVDAKTSLAKGLEALYGADAKIEFLQVLAAALPHRQSVWFACLCGRDFLADPEAKTPALEAADTKGVEF